MKPLPDPIQGFSRRLNRILALWVGVASVAYLHAAAAKPADTKKDAKPATNAPPKALVIPKSVFTSIATSGKDPFFPDSTRRTKPIPGGGKSDTNLINTIGGGSGGPGSKKPIVLALQGLSGTRTNRHALINGRLFAASESGAVSITNGVNVRIKCLEIRSRSVLVQVDGEAAPRELKFRGE